MLLDEKKLMCPWCGELNTFLMDPSAGDGEFIEDCHVCCAPIVYTVHTDFHTGDPLISARKENE